eukprot:CAMPEP_0119548490 /NCGR_PEP_ID=MMETSP1352-20130426/2409_1 /TAXON_ID=265584 /ORGANISM="Stauroneis constricta, Strain CCMP1120" /LENGTH=387 /DNA_ID=CAMNT_0007593787 /DNA_START=9 /DNA_END=1172 /DNA_ORIENTATION=-
MKTMFSNAAKLLLVGLLLNPEVIEAATARTKRGPRGFRQAVRKLDDDSKKKKKAPSKRDCAVDAGKEGEHVQFKCKAKVEDDATEIKDEIKFKVSSKAQESLKVKVEYEQEIEVEVNDTETETETSTKFEVEFTKIIEYRKNSDVAVSASDAASMAYDWENDEVVATWEMNQWKEFSDIVEDGSLSTFSISTMNDVAKFEFTITRADTADITANSMKIDFDLINYPWVEDDTYVALICSVKSEKKVEVEYEDGSKEKPTDVKISFDDAVDTIGFTPFGKYTWATEAQAIEANSTEAENNATAADSGETIAVVATSSPDTESDEIAFSFVGSVAQSSPDIYWDPEAGIGYAEGDGDGSGAVSMLFGMGSATIAATVGVVVATMMMMMG